MVSRRIRDEALDARIDFQGVENGIQCAAAPERACPLKILAFHVDILASGRVQHWTGEHGSDRHGHGAQMARRNVDFG